MKLKEGAINKTYFIEDCIQYYKIIKDNCVLTIWRSFKNRKHSKIITIKTNKITMV
jgi:hypothetical protein